MSALRESLARAAVVLASVVVTLGVVECGLRVTRAAPLPDTQAGGFRPGHPLLRMLQPNVCKEVGALDGPYLVEVCTNRLGLRDREHAGGERPRVLGLGDSFTFGWGVEQSDTYLAHLERGLRLALPAVRPGVFSAGLSYTSQAHQDVLLRYVYDKVNPDVILLAFAEDNDIDENIIWNPNVGVFPEAGEISPAAVEAYRQQLRGVMFGDFLYRHSALVRFFRQRHIRSSVAAEVAAVDERLQAHGLSGAPLSRMIADEARRRFLQSFGYKYDSDWRVTEILLDRIRGFAAERKADLVLLRIPSRMSVEDRAWREATQSFCGSDLTAIQKACGTLDRSHTARRLRAYARAHDLPYVDPGDDLRAAVARGEHVYLPQDIHLSRLGHARVGEHLTQALLPRLGGRPAPSPPPVAAQKPRSVGAYWYPWYRTSDWRSFSDYTPRGGAYVSTDIKTIARQLQTAERAELDFLFIELLAEHNREAQFNNQAVDAMVNAIVERRRRGYSDLKFAILSDIYLGEGDIGTKERWLEATKQHLDEIFKRFVEPQRESYFHVDGKPLIGVFSPPTSIDDARYIVVRPYWVSHEQWADWSRKTELTPFWDIFPQVVTDRRFVSVVPGYNDWRLERQPQVGPYLPRLAGRTFVEQWRRAFEMKPEVVLVYSFNEYFEQTQIEPTLEQADRYLLLNQLLARRFKDGRPLSQDEALRFAETLEPTARPDEEKVAWLAIDDPRLTIRGVTVKDGRAELRGAASIEIAVDTPRAFVVGLAHRPSFDRCAGLSITLHGKGPAQTGIFATELTQLSVLRDAPQPRMATSVKLQLSRVPAAKDCADAGPNPILLTGVTRYPLPTSQRENLHVDDPNLTLEGFWPIERGDVGVFAWSTARASLHLSGLVPGARYHVALTFQDTANFGNISLGPDEAHLKRAELTPARTAAYPEPLTVSAHGTLQLVLQTPTWKPSELFKSDDKRALGVALKLVTLDRFEGTNANERH